MTDEKEGLEKEGLEKEGIEKENRHGDSSIHLEARKKRTRGKPFEKGWKGGPGRPPRDVELTYVSAIYGKVSISDWEKVIEKALEQAKRGDKDARRYLHEALGADRELWEGVEPSMERIQYWIETLTARAAKQKQLEAAEQDGRVVDVTPGKKD